MRFGVIAICSRIPSLFSHSEKGFCVNWGNFLPGSSRGHGKKLQNEDEHLRTPVPRMRQGLGQPAAQHLRRLFLAARNYLRLRFHPLAYFARSVRLARAEHVALSRVAAAAGGVSALPPRWFYPADKRSAARRKDWIAGALC